MDDERTSMILHMLSDLHGEIAAIGFEETDAAERLDVVEADVQALIGVVAEGMRSLGEMGERLARLEAARS